MRYEASVTLASKPTFTMMAPRETNKLHPGASWLLVTSSIAAPSEPLGTIAGGDAINRDEIGRHAQVLDIVAGVPDLAH